MTLKNKKTVFPIYAFALCWVLCSIIFPVYKLWALILTAVLSGIASYLTYMVLSSQKPSAEEIKQEQENISYGPKVDPIVKEGRMALA